ncbi:MAG TPA: helix-turn-helix domain-containing protein [Syntrophorhabdaceae bacterium]|nr:helix-turn-helix domain-containing protein [Syntrophorhabdaceae bacterium]
MKPSADHPIQVKDIRERDFYIAQRDLVDRAGPVIGPFGCAVYNSLLRHADAARECWPSLTTIADEWGMSKMQAIREVEVLEAANMILVLKEHGKPNKYRLLDAKHWKLPELVTGSDRSGCKPVTHGDRPADQVVTGSHRSGSELVTDSDPKYIKESKSKPKPKTPLSRESGETEVDYEGEIKKALDPFDPDTRTAIKAFLDNVKSHNKTGLMKESRYLALLSQLAEISKGFENDVFRAALQTATDNEAYSVNYVRTVATTKAKQKNAATPPFQGGANATGSHQKGTRPTVTEDRRDAYRRFGRVIEA